MVVHIERSPRDQQEALLSEALSFVVDPPLLGMQRSVPAEVQQELYAALQDGRFVVGADFADHDKFPQLHIKVPPTQGERRGRTVVAFLSPAVDGEDRRVVRLSHTRAPNPNGTNNLLAAVAAQARNV